MCTQYETEKRRDLGHKRCRAAVHLVLGAVPGDAGEVGHVRVHQEHVASLHYHTKALTTEENHLGQEIILQWPVGGHQ